MDNFKSKFIEEANDHINELEKALLELDEDKENITLIEQIFRAMHSLKGSGAMFGFEKISEFTHHLETIYDYIRNGKLEITKDLLNTTLESVDHIKLLLENESDEIDASILKNHNDLLKQIDNILIDNNCDNDQYDVKNKNHNNQTKSTYYIHFIPDINIFNNGTNPLYLVDELYNMGDAVVLPNICEIPLFNKLNPGKCYVSWEIILSTVEEVESIKNVFMFVESECFLEIEKVSSINLLEHKKFISFINDCRILQKGIGFEELLNFIGNFESTVSSKVKKAIQNRNKLVTKDSSISSIRVASEKLDSLMNLVSELVTTQARLQLFSSKESNSELISISENIQKLSKQLRDITFSIVLIPIETMITRFQRLIRDLSYELKKEVRFVVEGADTELDKTIIENLTDPILHLLRNCIDHGIELPDERRKKGKKEEGLIVFRAFYSGANVHIQIFDDGAGIDTEFIRSKAISKGLISTGDVLSHNELLDLIFVPGFSTAKTITDVSGRGVGMDVVKKKIKGIRGDVEIESEPNKGTTVTIKLPLTLSIIDGLLVQIDNTHFVIPLAVVEKIYAVEHSKLVKSFNNVIALDGIQYPYFNLRNEFEMAPYEGELEQVIIIKYNDIKVGLSVDIVVGEYQAVLKPLGKHYKNQEIISGATILGDGTIALVIDPNKAVKYFTELINIEE